MHTSGLQELVCIAFETTLVYFQNEGYFKSLIKCVEYVLKNAGIKMLVLPSVAFEETMWQKFGFQSFLQDEDDYLKNRFMLQQFLKTRPMKKVLD